jgi:SAM-dependent methyltransferase
MPPEFITRDPVQAAFWTERFEQQFMPWDRKGVPQQLQDFVQAGSAPLVTLVPGCGAGHEVGYLAAAGWQVCGIDFSVSAVAAAHAVLGEFAGHVQQADFFTFTPPVPLQMIYERAFLCALPRALWPQIIERYADLLPSGGLLAGFFFFDPSPKGPPFGADPAMLDALLAPRFIRIEDQPVADSVPAFAGRERWQVWRRV